MRSFNKLTLSIVAASLSLSSFSVTAENIKDQIKLKPSALILLDAAGYLGNDNDQFESGVAIPDVRIGLQATFCESWFAKIDVKYANKKVSPCDIYIQKIFNERHDIKIGSFIYQFGLQAAYPSFLKPMYEAPGADLAMAFDRLLGAQYTYNGTRWFFAGAIHAGPKAIEFSTNQRGRSEWGALFRTLWRPRHQHGDILSVGISGAANTAQNLKEQDCHDYYTLMLPFPTQVSCVTAASATLDNVKGVYRFSPEFLIAKGKWAFETQYYLLNAQRKNGQASYTAQGGYGYIRFLARGDRFNYSAINGGIALPRPGQVEIVGGVDYVSLTDNHIEGGRLMTASVTGNWFINKYLTWRLRTGYSHRTHHLGAPDIDNFTFETRLMFLY